MVKEKHSYDKTLPACNVIAPVLKYLFKIVRARVCGGGGVEGMRYAGSTKREKNKQEY